MKKKDIGKLYGEQFQNFEAPVSAQEWLAVKAGLGKTKLLALHMTHFKVYYIAAAVAVGTSGVATGIYQYYNSGSDKPKDPIQKKIMIQPSAGEKKTDSIIHYNEGRDNQKQVDINARKYNTDPKTVPSDILTVDTANNSTDNVIPVKTEENRNNKADTTSAFRPKAPAKRVVYVNKTDTIIVRDTLTEPPKKRRKK